MDQARERQAWPGELGQRWRAGDGSEKRQQDGGTCPLTGGGDEGEGDERRLVFYGKLYEFPRPL